MTTQTGPIILVSFYATRIDPPKGGSMILITKTSINDTYYENLSLLVQFLLNLSPESLVCMCI